MLTKEQLTSFIEHIRNDEILMFRSDPTPWCIELLIDYIIKHEDLDLPREFTDEYISGIKDWNKL